MDRCWYLQQVDIFQGIDEEGIMKVAQSVVERHCPSKELLYTSHSVLDTIYVLKKGEVTLYASYEGQKKIIQVLGPGSLFGNLSLGEGAPSHSAEVSQDALVCMFTKEDFMGVLGQYPEVMLRLMQVLAQRIQQYEEQLQGSLLTAKEKILAAVVQYQKPPKGILGNLFGRKTALTHERLAQMTGLTRETVSRGIIALREEGRELMGL